MNTQEIADKYRERLDTAATKDQLLDALLTMDDGWTQAALAVVRDMDDDGFVKWREGITGERKGVSNEDAWYEAYLDLLVPPPFAAISLLRERWSNGE